MGEERAVQLDFFYMGREGNDQADMEQDCIPDSRQACAKAWRCEGAGMLGMWLMLGLCGKSRRG